MHRAEREAFIQRLVTAQVWGDSAAIFAEVIREAARLCTDAELSTLFNVSRPTVNRWRNGKTTPHRLIKQRIYEMLIERMSVGAQKPDPTPTTESEEGLEALLDLALI